MSDGTESRIVVVGSGGAGLTAAVAAAASGAAVTVLEAASTLGGTTALSGGEVWIPNNPWAAAEGIEDSDEQALEYLNHLAVRGHSATFISAFLRNGVRVAQSLEKVTPLRWKALHQPDYLFEAPGALMARTILPDVIETDEATRSIIREDPRTPPPNTIRELREKSVSAEELQARRARGVLGRGRGLVAGLYLGARELGVEFKVNARARELVVEGDAVVGVVAEGVTYPGKVILCDGGFENNPELVDRFLRGPMEAPCGAPFHRGDALEMAIAVGAMLGNMSEAWWSPAHYIPGETNDGEIYYRPLFSDRSVPGTLVVDQNGHRYANEAASYDDFGRAMHEWDASGHRYPRSPSWMIFDAARAGENPNSAINPKNATAWLIGAPNIAELATKIGVPAETLQRTVETYNTYAALGRDPEFHRGEYRREQFQLGSSDPAFLLRPLTEAPFYAVEILSGCIGTKGGPQTDELARVLREDGSVIDGLFAAGNAAAVGFGYGYPGGGGTIAPGMVFGWLAGETAAR